MYFTPNEYKQIHSPEAIVRGCDISCSAEKLIRLVHRSLDRTQSNSTIPNHVRQLIEQVTEERKRGLKKEDEREGIAFVTEQQPTLYEEVWNRMTVEEQLFYSNAVCSLERSWNVLEGLQSLEELLYLVHLGSIEQLV